MRTLASCRLRNWAVKPEWEGVWQMNIAVLGFKGGVGKTTTAVHLALYLQRCAAQAGTPQVSLLLDADPNRSASRWAERGSPFPV